MMLYFDFIFIFFLLHITEHTNVVQNNIRGLHAYPAICHLRRSSFQTPGQAKF